MTARLGTDHPGTRLLNQNVKYLRNLTTVPERFVKKWQAERAKYHLNPARRRSNRAAGGYGLTIA